MYALFSGLAVFFFIYTASSSWAENIEKQARHSIGWQKPLSIVSINSNREWLGLCSPQYECFSAKTAWEHGSILTRESSCFWEKIRNEWFCGGLVVLCVVIPWWEVGKYCYVWFNLLTLCNRMCEAAKNGTRSHFIPLSFSDTDLFITVLTKIMMRTPTKCRSNVDQEN